MRDHAPPANRMGRADRMCDEDVLHYRVMTSTLTIRLDARDRADLEQAARRQGKGLSTFVRDLAEAQARRVRRDAIRADGEQVMAHLAEHAEARAELDDLGTPLSEEP